MGSRAQALYLLHMGLGALQHVKSSWSRNGTCGSCGGKQILSHWTTREVNDRNLLPYSPGGYRSKIKMLTGMVSSEGCVRICSVPLS